MQKFIIIFRPDKDETHAGFANRLRADVTTIADNPEIAELWMTFTVGPAPRAVMPFKEGPICCVSARCHSIEDGPELAGLGFDAIPGFSELYKADEAVPVRYSRDWETGNMTPGVCLLTLFHKRPNISYETFIRRWYEGHTPLSLRLHPLWHYNRNAVSRVAPAGSNGTETDAGANQPFDGIVEEHFRTRKDLLNPLRFYGRIHVLVPHMLRVLIDILGFIHLRRIETYFAREIIIKSAAPTTGQSPPTTDAPNPDHWPSDPSVSSS